jgi:hypothetical protein
MSLAPEAKKNSNSSKFVMMRLLKPHFLAMAQIVCNIKHGHALYAKPPASVLVVVLVGSILERFKVCRLSSSSVFVVVVVRVCRHRPSSSSVVVVIVVCRLSSFVFRLSSVVCRLSSFVCRLSSFVCRLSSVVCRLSSVVCTY